MTETQKAVSLPLERLEPTWLCMPLSIALGIAGCTAVCITPHFQNIVNH